MIPFTTTAEQKVEVYGVATTMKHAGLPDRFIQAAVEVASEYEGAYDLMVLWRDTDDEEARADIVHDLQEAIDEREEQQPDRVEEKPYIHFDRLGDVAGKVIDFKRRLRAKVDAWGGVSRLSRETGIPQPSLSRFFNSASMPRRVTLYRIARALDLPENEIVTDWIR